MGHVPLQGRHLQPLHCKDLRHTSGDRDRRTGRETDGQTRGRETRRQPELGSERIRQDKQTEIPVEIQVERRTDIQEREREREREKQTGR